MIHHSLRYTDYEFDVILRQTREVFPATELIRN